VDVSAKLCPPLIKKKDPDTAFRARQIGELTMIPIYLVGGPLIGFAMGSWIDKKFGSAPYGQVVLIILGLMAAAREAWRIIRQISDSEKPSRS
jgi:ATP synthase protein I